MALINDLVPGLVPEFLTGLADYLLSRVEAVPEPFKETIKKKEEKEEGFPLPTPPPYKRVFRNSVHPSRPVSVPWGKEYGFYDTYMGDNTLPLVYNVAYSDPKTLFLGQACLNCIPLGLVPGRRPSEQVVIKSCNVRFSLLLTVGTPSTPCVVRWILAYSKDTNRTAATMSELLKDTFYADLPYVADFHSQVNYQNTAATSIVRDKYIILDPVSSTISHVNEYVKGDWPMSFASTLSTFQTITLVQTGAIYLCIFYQPFLTSGGTSTVKVCDIVTRVRFTDTRSIKK